MAQLKLPTIEQNIQDARGDLHEACLLLRQANISLADSMAAAAAAWSAHGYDQFVAARDLFIQTNSQFFDELEMLERLAQLEHIDERLNG